MGLENVKRVYEKLGQADPLWAILTDDRYRGNRWDPTAFFDTGRVEIKEVMTSLESEGIVPAVGSALDFGCGVGRLTQALCQKFESVIGVDISSTMIEGANRWNQFGERCRYIVNTTPTIPRVADSSIDFVYSNIALQHSPPRYQRSYIGEFVRMLRPQGVAVFQVRIGPHRDEGSLQERWYRFTSETLRPGWKRMRGRPPVQVHTISERNVEQVIATAGAEILAVTNADEVPRASRRSLRYVIRKPSA